MTKETVAATLGCCDGFLFLFAGRGCNVFVAAVAGWY